MLIPSSILNHMTCYSLLLEQRDRRGDKEGLQSMKMFLCINNVVNSLPKERSCPNTSVSTSVIINELGFQP